MTELKIKVESPELATLIVMVLMELEKAEKKHPEFPTDTIHQAAIMAEESGEVVRASLQFIYEGGKVEDVRKELLQTAAMCFRMLKNLPNG